MAEYQSESYAYEHRKWDFFKITAAQWRPTTVPRCHWQHENSFLGQANGERYRYDAGSTWVDAVSFPASVVFVRRDMEELETLMDWKV